MAVQGDKDYASKSINDSGRYRDTRSMFDRVLESIKSPRFAVWIVLSSLIGIVFPTAVKLLFFINLYIFFKYKGQSLDNAILPLYKPIYSSDKTDPRVVMKDVNEAGDTVTLSHGKPAALIYYGNVVSTNEEVWLTNNVQRQHIMFFGTTGSGKTFSLTGVAGCTLAIGSGFTASDGKGDISFPREVLALCYRTMRVNDFYLLTYLTGGRSIWNKPLYKITNNFNPFANASLSDVIELFKSLLDGDGDIWAKRADNFISCLAKPLVYKRDQGQLKLSVNTFANYMTLENLGLLISDPSIPALVKETLNDFVRNLPGMKPEFMAAISKGQSINSTTVYDQLGYVTMQIINVINDLIGDYRHIFSTSVGEVDMEDAIRNKRVVLCLLPALEKAPATIANLGRIVIASQKSMMARNLGDKFEGDLDKHLNQRPTASNTPYLCIYDEVGYYFVEGLGAILAQARSIGCSIILSAQDLPAMKKLSEKIAKEVETAFGNTNTKIAGRIEDSETAEKIIQRADKEFTTEVTNIERTGGILDGFSENSYSIQERDRLRPGDMYRLNEGEVVMQHKTELLRVDLVNIMTKDIKLELINVSLIELMPRITFNDTEVQAIKKGLSAMRFVLLDSLKKDTHNHLEATANQRVLQSLSSIHSGVRDAGLPTLMTGVATLILQSYLTSKKIAKFVNLPIPVPGFLTAEENSALEPVSRLESSNSRVVELDNEISTHSDKPDTATQVNSIDKSDEKTQDEIIEAAEAPKEEKPLYAENLLTFDEATIKRDFEANAIGFEPEVLATQLLDINLLITALNDDADDSEEGSSGGPKKELIISPKVADDVAHKTNEDVNELVRAMQYEPQSNVPNEPSDVVKVLNDLSNLLD